VLSEGVHSFLDLVSAGLAFFTVREAGKPADEDHPFGHGKIETLSSLFESLLLVVAAGLIVYEGMEHLQSPQPVQHQGLAMFTILISMIVSFIVFRHNGAAARITESSALKVNSLHFFADVMASAGILLGLVLLKLTGKLIIDPIMAFAVAAYILVISAKQVIKALGELSDIQLPQKEIEALWKIIEKFRDQIIEAHDLRTRKSGATRHIDFHLVVCGALSVERSHSVCDQIEEGILKKFPNASVNIHVEPCEYRKTGCQKTCGVFLGR
jgi:cation diffusion facilitator family transporter